MMIKGKCIYCKEEKDLSREHAFPKSLLKKGTPGWVIDKHLCRTCNSRLAKLDVVLSRKSHMAYVWDQIQNELRGKTKNQHSTIYNKKAVGISPVGLFFPDPLYDNLIILHEPDTENSGISTCINSMTALHPQMVLMQYPNGQTCAKVVAENLEKFNTANSDEHIIDYDEQEGVYCLLGNAYLFPPKSTWYFLGKVTEFKSKFMKDFPHTRYDLRVIYPEDSTSWDKVNAFFNSLQGETKKIIEGDKSLKTEVFTQPIQVIPDRKATPYIIRPIAKTAFHCFLYHYTEFSGHEPIFAEIRDFIYTGTPNKFVAQCRNTETADLVYDSTEHLHVFYFFLRGNDIGCRIDFFTGLLPNQFSYEVTLAGNPEDSHPSCTHVAYIPFSVHPKSQMKRRILARPELGIIQKPRENEGVLWLPRSTL